MTGDYLFAFLGGHLGILVDDLDAELGGPLDNGLSGPSVKVMGDDSSELLVLHQEHVDVLSAPDNERVKTVLQLEASGLV